MTSLCCLLLGHAYQPWTHWELDGAAMIDLVCPRCGVAG